jgi:transcriptional regulator with XRE-family HTH domain
MAEAAPAPSPHELLTTGERIRWLRRRQHLSQRALADAIGISEQALGNYERDERPLPGEVARALAVELKTTTDYLLRLKATPS